MIDKVGIIGGGASGMMAAIIAARAGSKVMIIEHKERVGKKILMTGNGKCNLTNLHMDQSFYYSHDIDFAMDVLNSFTPKDTIDFFKSIGLMTKEKREGGIYPVAEQAAVVLDMLRDECERLDIRIETRATVEKIETDPLMIRGYIEYEKEPEKEKEVSGKKKKAKAELIKKPFKANFTKLILACGGKAASVSGSDGSGYELCKKLGIKIHTPLPALVQLIGEGNYFKAMAGVRTEAALKLYVDHKLCAREYGELQLTEYGISGIPVFQFSRICSEALFNKKNCNVEIDFLPFEGVSLNYTVGKERSIAVFLEGYLNKKLIPVICKQTGLYLEQKVDTISEKQRKSLENTIHHFSVKVKGTNSFDSAQVCAGGVSLKEMNKDFSLKKHPDIFIVGELLDVDGKCGGYNLQWAWASGFLAGKACGSKT